MAAKIARKPLDLLLVERGLAASRQSAQAMILAGEVHLGSVRAQKAGQLVPQDSPVEVRSRSQKYAGRGGLKLEGALRDFGIHVTGRTCLDLGASSGGFTDCLLQHGAAHVYAVDVTSSQLAWKLRQDARVVRIEKNVRELSPADLPESASLITMDLSFISASKVLPAVAGLLPEEGDLLILVKPQFELRREQVPAGGVIRDPALHEEAIQIVRDAAGRHGLTIAGVAPSCLPGAEGNQEFFLHARRSPVK